MVRRYWYWAAPALWASIWFTACANGLRCPCCFARQKENTSPNISYFQADAKDCDTLRAILRNNYDAIVDFLLYSTIQFLDRYRILLSNTNHYIYLSSYRVFAGSDTPINEDSAQLLDISDNKRFLATDDYALAKARQEDILENSRFRNWTIVRPAITYSKLRYQLVTLEANTVVARAFKKRPVVPSPGSACRRVR